MAQATAGNKTFEEVKGEVLSDEAVAFLRTLQREFNARRKDLLAEREQRQETFNSGELPDFLEETKEVREGDWQVAPCPDDLQDRRVEITGPAERKMTINALNSGANVFMADLEDALSPTWENVVMGQQNLKEAVRGTLRLEDEARGKTYELEDELATLLVRPRGWHLVEKHLEVDGEAISASLFDFGLYMFHNAQERLDRGTGPYFYLPKLEHYQEARLWNDVINFTQDELGIPRGSVRATVLIETIHAAYQMEEILYELREHISGFNAGRWDYIFSFIKAFHSREDMSLPDRGQVTMSVPFMHAYTELMIKTCHKRGAHAIGGMAAFIPSRDDPEVTENALAKVAEDKKREAEAGCDGTWVAHPGLIPTAKEQFDAVLGDKPNQVQRQRDDVSVSAKDLINTDIENASISEAGMRQNVNVALQYINSWLSGTGAAAIFNLMEDAATAEISRAQLWQWLHHGATLENGEQMSVELYDRVKKEELETLEGDHLQDAADILDDLVKSNHFHTFLTLKAYDYLD